MTLKFKDFGVLDMLTQERFVVVPHRADVAFEARRRVQVSLAERVSQQGVGGPDLCRALACIMHVDQAAARLAARLRLKLNG